MPLTRPRAYQISNLDFKQSVRAISLSNIVLDGSAPATVDGITLSEGDRVLVAGQTEKSENGIYAVETAGTGSNGVWERANDFDTNSGVSAGIVIMVTEGSDYEDTQWKLTTDDPITIGTTDLDFEQASAYGFGRVDADGELLLSNQVGDTLTIESGNNISISGDTETKTLTIAVTGISLDSISNGSSNVSIDGESGNVITNIAGSQVIETNSEGVSVTGNITGNNIFANGTMVVNGTVASALIPATDDTYSLGNVSHRWSNLFLTGNTIQMGNLQLKDVNGVFSIFESDGTTPAAISFAEVTSEEDIFSDGANYGSVTAEATTSIDLGNITDTVVTEITLGDLVQAGILQPNQITFPSFTVDTVPPAVPAGQMIYVSDESGGAVIAFSDGTDWRRITDRSVIT